jgi:copper chaperone NosL
MKKIKNLIFTILFTGSLISCNTEPEPINYGTDACNFCEMTIVSKAHSARAVSDKGKQFKYDAIECMVHDEIRNQVPKSIRQVADFSHPGSMISVNQAVFVINDSINSPMGANLAALKENTGTSNDAGIYSWEELISHFQKENSLSSQY